MGKVLGTPWDFLNEYTSRDNKLTLDFENVYEIVMDAPLSGTCFLKIEGGKIKLNVW